MNGVGVKQSPAEPDPEVLEPQVLEEKVLESTRERQTEILRWLWNRRRIVLRAGTIGFLASMLFAFSIPSSYTSTAQLMPPDSQSSTSGLAMMAAMATKTGGGLASMAGDLLGLKSSGALFIGVLRSETSQERLVQQFDLKKVYGARLVTDARKKLDENTAISEDRKSGIITISVTDHSPQRAAAMANAYVDQLNSLVTELSTSSAHRERVFLEERLKVAKQDLDDAANALAQFSSKNNTLDIQTEGKAMLDAAGTLAGQMIAAQSELEGLRQIYTPNNARVRSLNARVQELRKQLEKLGGTQSGATNNASPVLTQSVTSPSDSKTTAAIPFPSIRNLPILGAKYADLYQRAKIQATVFELLTEQYELAKVEEAKETPSVKVLDPAKVPERKSFPPHLLIVCLGTFLVFASSVVWVLGAKSWEETDPGDPRKAFAHEVVATLKRSVPWAPEEDGVPRSRAQRVWSRLSSRRPRSGSAEQ